MIFSFSNFLIEIFRFYAPKEKVGEQKKAGLPLFSALLLGGIGFTMSIFITNLAFVGGAEVINDSKMAILAASLIAGTIGFAWLKIFGKPKDTDTDTDTMDYDMTEV